MDLSFGMFQDLGDSLIGNPEYNREIDSDLYCFEALSCPKDHPARTMQDTSHLEEDQRLLQRTQISAVHMHYMEKNSPPLAIITPGRVLHCDTVDAAHTPQFHQIEISAMEEGTRLNVGSLRATVPYFLHGMFGDDIKTRYRASYFTFAGPSMEGDVFLGGRWLEELGCDMVHPRVLERVGIDPETHQGFVACFGV